jgi:hypothetical protein
VRRGSVDCLNGLAGARALDSGVDDLEGLEAVAAAAPSHIGDSLASGHAEKTALGHNALILAAVTVLAGSP